MALEAEFQVRKHWWRVIEQTGVDLNTAMLDSIGHNLKKERNGLWQTMVTNRLLMYPTVAGKGGKKQQQQQQAQAQGGNPTGQPGVQQPWGQGKKNLKRQAAQAAAGMPPPAAARKGAKAKGKGAAQQAQSPWPAKGKAAKGKGAAGAPAPKGGKGMPAIFTGKMLTCTTHTLRMCFDHHITGCRFGAACSMCHACCPEPGCTMDCSTGGHGLWVH